MKKSIALMFHILFWIFTSLLVYMGFGLLSIPFSLFGESVDIKEYLKFLSIVLPIGAIFFYSSYYSLNFFVKKSIRFAWIGIFYVGIISLIVILGYIDSGEFDFLGTLFLFFPVLYFNAFGFLLKTFVEWINDRKIKAELEKDKVKSQLELLKSQINPHFLFNTLNNIDILILDEPRKASDYLKKLSEILRFMLYETDIEKVPLSKEVEYIKKYIELQKIRTSNDKFVNFDIIGETNDRFIAPMIFIHFVENAFKYATNKKIENAISIQFDISENQLSFLCKNHINSTDITKQENNGLGFRLIRQRLDLIYKKDYNLNVSNEDNWYIVQLEIKLGDD